MEGDTEYSTVQGSKDRNRINKKQKLKKSKRKGVQKKKLIDTQFESNINTVAEELVLSENAEEC